MFKLVVVISAICLFLSPPADSFSDTWAEVCFKHSVRGTVKYYCVKKTDDNKTVSYKCQGTNNKLEEFIPDNQWIELTGDSPLCSTSKMPGDLKDRPRGNNEPESKK